MQLVNDFLQFFTDIYDFLQFFTDIYDFLQFFTDIYNFLQFFDDIYDFLQFFTDICIKTRAKSSFINATTFAVHQKYSTNVNMLRELGFDQKNIKSSKKLDRSIG